MATQEYMTARPPAPSAPRLFVDQRLIPAAIDAAAEVDRVAAVLADRARAAPWRACLLAGFLGFVAAVAMRRQA